MAALRANGKEEKYNQQLLRYNSCTRSAFACMEARSAELANSAPMVGEHYTRLFPLHVQIAHRISFDTSCRSFDGISQRPCHDHEPFRGQVQMHCILVYSTLRQDPISQSALMNTQGHILTMTLPIIKSRI